MIPLIRSLTELMTITKTRVEMIKNKKLINSNDLIEHSGQRKRYLRLKDDELINLPDIPKATRRKWINGKKAISKLIDELDYNNQIQSSYDLTLLARQNKNQRQDAA